MNGLDECLPLSIIELVLISVVLISFVSSLKILGVVIIITVARQVIRVAKRVGHQRVKECLIFGVHCSDRSILGSGSRKNSNSGLRHTGTTVIVIIESTSITDRAKVIIVTIIVAALCW